MTKLIYIRVKSTVIGSKPKIKIEDITSLIERETPKTYRLSRDNYVGLSKIVRKATINKIQQFYGLDYFIVIDSYDKLELAKKMLLEKYNQMVERARADLAEVEAVTELIENTNVEEEIVII